jgi:hypothetical protein
MGLTLPKSRFPALVYGGVEWSYVISARLFENDMNSGAFESDTRSSMRHWDAAPVLGLGICAPGGIELMLQRSWGLRDIGREWPGDKNRSFWVLGTLWFDLL